MPASQDFSIGSCQRQKVAFAGPCSLINHPINDRRAEYGLRHKDYGLRARDWVWRGGQGKKELFTVEQKSKIVSPSLGLLGDTFAIHAAQNSYKSQEAPPKCVGVALGQGRQWEWHCGRGRGKGQMPLTCASN